MVVLTRARATNSYLTQLEGRICLEEVLNFAVRLQFTASFSLTL